MNLICKELFMTCIFESLSTLAVNLVENLGYRDVMLGTAFFPSEITMPLAGIAVSQGKTTLWGITLAAATGDVLGSLTVYFIALKGGRL